jgi:hypothetical protein
MVPYKLKYCNTTKCSTSKLSQSFDLLKLGSIGQITSAVAGCPITAVTPFETKGSCSLSGKTRYSNRMPTALGLQIFKMPVYLV